MDAAQAEILVNSLQNTTVGGWHISEFLGAGKSAVVLRCVRGVEIGAIKVFHPELIQRYGKSIQLERILREKSLVGFSHPNLIRILAGGECEETGHLYVVMEQLLFPNLHTELQKIPPETVPTLISQIASAARFLEDRGLIHRDIKPENIVVSPDFSRAVLLDLGVLRPVGYSNLTDVDQRPFIGTLRYSSPEFLERKEEDTLEGWRAVTFYQLGAVLHDLLMRRVLFEEESEPYPRLVKAVLEKIPIIHASNARCVALATHCLLKNPATRLELVNWERFQSLPVDPPNTLSLARDRIKQKQKFFQVAAIQSKPSASVSKLSRRVLDDVCNRVESRVASLMNDLQAFPLRTTKSVKDAERGFCETCIHFEKDLQKGIDFRLTFLLRFSLIDENFGKPIFRAEAAAAMTCEEILPSQMPIGHFIQSSELEQLLDGSNLEAIFMSALDNAYARVETNDIPGIDEIIELAVKEVAE
ncbi:protein kinase [Delftia sp. WSY_22]|uniref:protein kinase domain-containing protein n=1 Tax=Delftia sp. WSY_22 TaxID=3367213 RepID=UPI00370B9D89